MKNYFIIFLISLFLFLPGCLESPEYDVTINVLYSAPNRINNTSIYLDGIEFLNFMNVTLEFYPPHLGEKTKRLESGNHEIRVIDTNFNLTKTKTIEIKERSYVDIIISEDSISFNVDNKQTEYK